MGVCRTSLLWLVPRLTCPRRTRGSSTLTSVRCAAGHSAASTPSFTIAAHETPAGLVLASAFGLALAAAAVGLAVTSAFALTAAAVGLALAAGAVAAAAVAAAARPVPRL